METEFSLRVVKNCRENNLSRFPGVGRGLNVCGITGVVGGPTVSGSVATMNVALRHRGPDTGAGLSLAGGTTFGHRRLSIIDLNARSNQPFSKRGLTIVFNGEIYNYRNLRKELGRDVDFVTDSDTEVLVEAWRAWGPGCLSRLRGMFAFAVHEEATGRVWLCRDQFGIKPLFYLPLPDGGLAFASELKGIEAAFRSHLTLDPDAIIASLLYVWLPESQCVWREVRKLLPGHYLEIPPASEIKLHRW